MRRVYGIIHISEEVAAEFGVFVPAWIKVHSVQDKTKLDILHNLVDLGEASTITLAYQFMEQLSLLEFSDISQPTKGKELVFESVSKGFQLQSAD